MSRRRLFYSLGIIGFLGVTLAAFSQIASGPLSLLENSREMAIEIEGLPPAQKPVAPAYKESTIKPNVTRVMQGDVDNFSGVSSFSEVVVPSSGILDAPEAVAVSSAQTSDLEEEEKEKATLQPANFSKFQAKKFLNTSTSSP